MSAPRCVVCNALLDNGGCTNYDCRLYCPPEASESVLSEAARLVDGDRQTAYGHPIDNHSRTAEFWNTYINWMRRIHGDDYQLDAYDICHLNDLQKTSRDINQRKRDNLTDKAGFVRNAEIVSE